MFVSVMDPNLWQLSVSAGEQLLVNFREELKTPPSGPAADVFWIDFSNKWFTVMPSTMPFTVRGYKELADYVQICYSPNTLKLIF